MHRRLAIQAPGLCRQAGEPVRAPHAYGITSGVISIIADHDSLTTLRNITHFPIFIGMDMGGDDVCHVGNVVAPVPLPTQEPR